MPLQNRVDPWGRLHAVRARGALMGNRGILHDADRRVTRPWAHKHWVACLLSFQGRRQELFAPGRYSQLFFPDEATALAAGHRPCARCQRDRHEAFRTTWQGANARDHAVRTIDDLDEVLHAERAIRGGGKRTFEAPLRDLPDGACFESSGSAYLVWRAAPRRWSFDGYVHAAPALSGETVAAVLTPPPVVRMLRAGFVPEVHRSAAAWTRLDCCDPAREVSASGPSGPDEVGGRSRILRRANAVRERRYAAGSDAETAALTVRVRVPCSSVRRDR